MQKEVGSMLELVNWIQDGKYRILVLKAISSLPSLPSQIAKKLNINRASLSRVLNDLKDKTLIVPVKSSSRTITYTITDKGKRLLNKMREYDDQNEDKNR